MYILQIRDRVSPSYCRPVAVSEDIQTLKDLADHKQAVWATLGNYYEVGVWKQRLGFSWYSDLNEELTWRIDRIDYWGKDKPFKPMTVESDKNQIELD